MMCDISRCEGCELEAWSDCRRSTPDHVAGSLGVQVSEVKGAVATSVAGVDILASNRVLGVGVREAATPAFEFSRASRWLVSGEGEDFASGTHL